LRTIADQYGVSKTALLRHKQHQHVPQNRPRLPGDPALAASARRLHQEGANALAPRPGSWGSRCRRSGMAGSQ
jgi:hypothetical protein